MEMFRTGGRAGDPTVSVIVTVYDRTRFLKGALESVHAQGFAGLEVIVADDSDSAQIRRIVEDLGRPDTCYRPNPRRLGAALSVASALRAARGRYITILNDDDTWEPDFLRALVRPLEEDTRRVAAFSDIWTVEEDGTVAAEESEVISRRFRRADRPQGEVEDPGRAAILDKSVPLAMGTVFRRDALDPGQIAPEVGGAYDYWIACALAATGRPLYYVPRRLTRYRVHHRMETLARRPDRREDELYVVRRAIAAGWFPHLRRRLKRRLSDVCVFAGANKLLRFGRTREARAMFLEGLRAWPNPFCLAGWLASFTPPRLLRALLPLAERSAPLRAMVSP
jgi:glycosyltransferase involved in cell wall biosynthesis